MEETLTEEKKKDRRTRDEKEMQLILKGNGTVRRQLTPGHKENMYLLMLIW